MQEEQEIVRNLLRLKSPFKVATKMGLDIASVLAVRDRHPELLTPRSSPEFRERHGGEGRPELADYAVSRRKVWSSWDNTQPAIERARAAYEAGTHTMATGRDGDWIILYSIPQQKVTPRPDYFTVTHAIV